MTPRRCWFLISTTEVASAASLFGSAAGPWRVAGFLTLHGAASVLFAFALLPLLPERYRHPRRAALALVGLTAFLVPYAGALGLLACTLAVLRSSRSPTPPTWRVVDAPDLPHRSLDADARVAPSRGRLLGILRHSPDVEKRVRAVLAADRLPPSSAVPLLRIALRDAADDVRLLAYSLFDRKEQGISARIQELLRRLDGASPSDARAIHARLAQSYWDLGALGVAEGEVLRHVRAEARRHAVLGIGEGPAPQLRILLARVLLEEGKLARAQLELELARKEGFPASEVLPHLAEIRFRRRDFAGVRQALGAVDPVRLATRPLSSVAKYWL